jgi:hypothetical protein
MFTDKNDDKEEMIEESNKLLLEYPREILVDDELTHVIWDEKEGAAIIIAR